MKQTLSRMLCTTAPRLRPAPTFIRHAAQFPPSPPPTERPKPTVFSNKSSPQQVHERPEMIRGMPAGSTPSWAKGGGPVPAYVRSEKGDDFAGPSRPRLVYERPGEKDLPKLKNRVPLFVLLGLLGASAWGLVVFYATNAERLASSVVRQVTFQLRNSADVSAVLGDRVKLVNNWWSFGDPYISGTINNMQGRVDLKFRIQGDRDAGTLYFTSIRPKQEGAWRIVRYKVIADSGEVVQLEDKV